MPCYRPLTAWRTTENTPNGKKAIAFVKSASCIHPMQLPCGQCIGCKLDRSLQWAIRSVNEAQLHHQNSFITLTYDQDSLPWDGSLTKSHFVNFIKKLRNTYPSQTIRYYMCGEYGEKLSRPHYHACLFGLDWSDKEPFKNVEGIITYTSETLEALWGHGFCTIGELNFETAAYTARYIAKKVNGKNKEKHYTTTCPHTGNLIILEPEYNNMSRKPGLSKDWYEKYLTDIYPSDFLIHCGKKIKVPRYFDNLYEIDHDLEKIKYERKLKARKHIKDNTPERLVTREKLKNLNYKQLTRSYENDT